MHMCTRECVFSAGRAGSHIPARPINSEGVYDFQHAGGTFDVHLRPGGQFFAPKFMARSSWELTEDRHLLIDFGQFGDYRLAMTNEQPPMFEGSAVGDPSNWRKMCLKAPFPAAYRKLMDSVWNFEHAGGAFPVEFRADSFNHFVCKDFPVIELGWHSLPCHISPLAFPALLLPTLTCYATCTPSLSAGTLALVAGRQRSLHQLGQLRRVRACAGRVWRHHDGLGQRQPCQLVSS